MRSKEVRWRGSTSTRESRENGDAQGNHRITTEGNLCFSLLLTFLSCPWESGRSCLWGDCHLTAQTPCQVKPKPVWLCPSPKLQNHGQPWAEETINPSTLLFAIIYAAPDVSVSCCLLKLNGWAVVNPVSQVSFRPIWQLSYRHDCRPHLGGNRSLSKIQMFAKYHWFW